MVKPEWGTKRTCPKCGTRFYDLTKDDPVTCIECGEAWEPEPVLKSKQPILAEEEKKDKDGEADSDLGGDDDDLDIDIDEDDDSRTMKLTLVVMTTWASKPSPRVMTTTATIADRNKRPSLLGEGRFSGCRFLIRSSKPASPAMAETRIWCRKTLAK